MADADKQAAKSTAIAKDRFRLSTAVLPFNRYAPLTGFARVIICRLDLCKKGTGVKAQENRLSKIAGNASAKVEQNRMVRYSKDRLSRIRRFIPYFGKRFVGPDQRTRKFGYLFQSALRIATAPAAGLVTLPEWSVRRDQPRKRAGPEGAGLGKAPAPSSAPLRFSRDPASLAEPFCRAIILKSQNNTRPGG